MKCVVAAIVLAVGCGIAQADVYKWTDGKGEVHFGEFPTQPNPDAVRIMTQEQIQQEENAEKAARQIKPPPSPPDYNQEILVDVQHRRDECQHYKNLRDDRLMNSGPLIRPGYNALGYGYDRENINVNTMGMSEIDAGIRKYCLE